jgi:uridylate kinase
MRHRFGKTVVVALGGSIIYPEGIDAVFLKKFKKFIAPYLRRGTKFVLVIGGGTLARRFQDAAHKVARVADDDKDWLGIHATRLNAHLLRTIFRESADPVIIDARRKTKKLKYPITIAAGWRPGWSTDYVAMQIAADLGVPEVVIAGKPSHVYDKDPSKYVGARTFDELTWRAYRKLVPRKWKPGTHVPVDPIAAALGEKENIKAIVFDGRDLKNFGALLNGNEFRGTIVGATK